jgi:hypothetical protein
MPSDERPPVYYLTIGMGEMGKFDDKGEIRSLVQKSSVETLGVWALHKGFSEEESDENLDLIAKELRRLRRIRREQKSKE